MTLGKNAPLQTCPLCTNERQVVESHIIPRWVYKRIAETQPGRQPVAVKNGVVMYDSEQLSAEMLCLECETKVGRWDKYAAEVSYNAGSFPALDHALAHVVPARGNTPQITLADISGLDTSALTLFGTSVIWRAAACPKLCPTIKLDSQLFEKLRAYLYADGQLPFPNGPRLLLYLMNTPDIPQAQQATTRPAAGTNNGSVLYRVMLFGLCFELFIGGESLAVFDSACLPGRAILTDGQFHVPDLYNRPKAAIPKGKFAKRMPER